MKCNKCTFDGNPHLVVTGPHTKALCPECGSYIKMTTKQEREAIVEIPQAGAHLYTTASDMIKAAIVAGYHHVGGTGYLCKNCGNKSSARKFTKNGAVLFACNICGNRR